MKKLLSNVVLAASLSLLTVLQTQATLITSNTLEDAKVINFDGIDELSGERGSLELGSNIGESVTVESARGSYFVNLFRYSLSRNGEWRDGMTFVGMGGGAMLFSFLDGPVSSVGALLNYNRHDTLIPSLFITALGDSGQVLETYDVIDIADIVTPGEVNAGGFRGIQRQQNDIWGFMVDSRRQWVLDDLTFSRSTVTTPIPEPGLVIIFALSLLWLIRKRTTM